MNPTTDHRRSRPTLLPVAVTLFASASLGAAGAESLSGTWTYAGGEAEEKARFAAIDKATDGLNGFIKGKARGKLKERTAPPKAMTIQIEGSQLTLSGAGNKSLSLEMGAAPIEIKGDKGKAKVSAKAIPDGFVLVNQGEKGGMTTTYKLAGEALVANVKMTGERLKSPLDYRLSFKRK